MAAICLESLFHTTTITQLAPRPYPPKTITNASHNPRVEAGVMSPLSQRKAGLKQVKPSEPGANPCPPLPSAPSWEPCFLPGATSPAPPRAAPRRVLPRHPRHRPLCVCRPRPVRLGACPAARVPRLCATTGSVSACPGRQGPGRWGRGHRLTGHQPLPNGKRDEEPFARPTAPPQVMLSTPRALGCCSGRTVLVGRGPLSQAPAPRPHPA